MPRVLPLLLLSVALSALASAATGQGADFEGVDDFSIYNGNPNGLWSYGSTVSLVPGYTIQLMDSIYDTNPANPGTDCSYWYHSFNGGASGYVVCNKSNYDQFGCHRAKSLSVNPVEGQYTLRRLTLPHDAPTGKYYVYAFWQELWGDGTFFGDGEAVLLVNGQQKYSAYIGSYDTGIYEYEQFLTLQAGDVIDFANGCGIQGFSRDDWLQVQCRVAYVGSWIEGTVRESSSGTPVKGVSVTATNQGQPDTQTRTDYRGRYLLPVYAGTHTVTAEYFEPLLQPRTLTGVVTTAGQGTPLNIALETGGVPDGRIQGVVTAGVTGAVLQGVTVTATNQGQPDSQTVTDGQGRYVLPVFAGDHTVTASYVGTIYQPATISGVTTSFGQDKTLNISLETDRAADQEPVPTQAETDIANQWIADHLCRAVAGQAPFSFVYNGSPSSGLLPNWSFSETIEQLDSVRTRRTQTYLDPATKLQVRVVIVQYSDFPTVEWTVYLKNTGTTDTPILSSVQALNVDFERSADESEFTLHHNQGSLCQADDFRPFTTVLAPGVSTDIGTWGGRPTQPNMPYFNLQWGDRGLVLAIGWTGQWTSKWTRDADRTLEIVSGQEQTRFRLHAGEEVRTPLMALQLWQGGDTVRAQNIWRRWMIAHNLPKPGGESMPPVISLNSLDFNDGASNEIEMMNAYDSRGQYASFWWRDAGWYPCGGSWWYTGTWEPDPILYPNGLRESADAAHARGMRFTVWFEPERVTGGSWLAVNHPEWLLGGTLLNLGDPDAWNWLVNHISQLITDQGIDMYRQDFNMDPLSYWRGNDSYSRQGITENLHVQGLYAYWDELRRRHPNMPFDNCASGGRRLDLEMSRRGLPLSKSDYYGTSSPSQAQAWGLASWLPYYGGGSNGWDLYNLRSNLSPWSAFAWDARRADLDYTTQNKHLSEVPRVQPYFWGDFYTLTPYSLDEAVWMAWQYDLPEKGEGMVQAFRRAACTAASATYKLHGLDAGAVYEITNLDIAGTTTKTGRELMFTGLTIATTQKPYASIVTYRKLSDAGEARTLFAQSPVDHAYSGISDWSSDSQQADDFMLAVGPATVTRVRWWGSYGANPDPAIDNFAFQFSEEDPGRPGYPSVFSLGDGIRHPAVFSRSVTSFVSNPSGAHDGGMVYEYSATLDRPITLQANKQYWLAITNSTPPCAYPVQPNSRWGWLGASAGSHWSRTGHSALSAEPWMVSNTANLAFELDTFPRVGIGTKAASDPAALLASSRYLFTTWGRVKSTGAGTLELDDGSGSPITVEAPGFAGIGVGDYITVTGFLSEVSGDPVIKADPDDVTRSEE